MNDLIRLADSLAPDVRAAFLRMVAAVRFNFPEEVLVGLIARRDLAGITALANEAAASGLLASSREFAGILTLLATQSASYGLTGALQRPLTLATQWARANAGSLLTQWGEEVALSVRDYITRGIGEQVHPRETARLIREVVGLTPGHSAAVANYENGLRAAGNPRATELTARYAQRLLNYRANMITRTETINASHAGQYAAWVSQTADGLLRPGAMVEWIVTDDDRLCERCAPMDGARVLLGELFSVHKVSPGVWAPGGTPDDRVTAVLHPPLHPNCRCTVGLISVAALQREKAPESQLVGVGLGG